MTAPIISFINMKGGVGKTTLCVGIGEYLANYMNKKILIIDVDPQFNATQSLMGKYDRVDEYINKYLKDNRTIRRIFETQTTIMNRVKTAQASDVIIKVEDNLHMILGDINIIFDTTQEAVRIKRIGEFIRSNNLREEYDYILIDSPPTISLFTDSALVTSDYYIVPVKIDYYSILGATSLLNVVRNLKDNHSLTIEHLGFIYTNTNRNPTQKTSRIKEDFETKQQFSSLYFFNNGLPYERHLMVGLRGNIPSCYNKSRIAIENICHEFVERVDMLERIKNG
ncbi:ParA family protein [Xenorhabdus hominickii]|uniref:Chromosome partitioning protein ParA n=1 Tax=Xenorhabdus hominickii TaxID=351679 RepID=A0A2G0Q2K9_XENHO|nr:AAA family ATPase [Xenorhabdus hominickii]AOM39688.1 chromosome partitioning protein ParA [Xenorhabdus hominickii]PHM53445.1 CobQ/CobB/MinD/ParA family protein [Xenorhabdus hominickii]